MGRRLTRRDFLRAGVLAGSYAALAGCGGAGAGRDPNELSFAFWGGPAEIAAFQKVIDRYKEKNPEVTVTPEVSPFDGFYEQVDARLVAGQAPDLVRLQYQEFGRYGAAGALVDLTDHLDAGYEAVFDPSFWEAVTYRDTPYALPHHTDTSAVFYNTDYFEKAGIEVPQSRGEAWTLEEFDEVARRAKDETDAEYGFAWSWQGSTAYRWMPLLYVNGGQLLDDDLKTPLMRTPEGVETIELTKRWYEDGVIPLTASFKSTEQIQTLFAIGTTAMMVNGDFMMQFFKENAKDLNWGVTYLPRGRGGEATVLGGNAVGITRDSANPEAAADFLKFLVDERNMRDFVTAASFLPVRESLLRDELKYPYRPEDMALFEELVGTLPENYVQINALPEFNQIDQKVADQLELAVTSGQSARRTAQNVDDVITDILAQ